MIQVVSSNGKVKINTSGSYEELIVEYFSIFSNFLQFTLNAHEIMKGDDL